MIRLSIASGITAALLLLGACSTTTAPDTGSGGGTDPGGQEQSGVETEPVEVEPVEADPAADADEEAGLGPDETFLAWLEASRIPETDVACGYMSEGLIEKMIAEFKADYGTDPGGCEGLTELTADLYRTFNQSAEVTISVVSEDESDAVLSVTYVQSGDCVTVVLQKSGGGWIMTEQTTGCHQQ